MWTVDTSPMWTVVFGPKVGFHLSNVDTKIKVYILMVRLAQLWNKHCPQKKKLSTVIMDTFPVDITCSLQWTLPVTKPVWTLSFWTLLCGHLWTVDTSLWTVYSFQQKISGGQIPNIMVVCLESHTFSRQHLMWTSHYYTVALPRIWRQYTQGDIM